MAPLNELAMQKKGAVKWNAKASEAFKNQTNLCGRRVIHRLKQLLNGRSHQSRQKGRSLLVQKIIQYTTQVYYYRKRFIGNNRNLERIL